MREQLGELFSCQLVLGDSLAQDGKRRIGLTMKKVTYFKKRRVMEYQRNQTLEKLKAEGAKEMPGEIGAGALGQKP